MITSVFIGVDRLDLFEDEPIVINSSLVKIEDITKIFTDTSNDFTVPANDNNNNIFKHWYNSNLINGFDARKKIPAVIEIDGLNYKVGKIRLKKVNFKHNQPDNYSVEFFGNLVELKDLLKDDKLTDLDLSAYDFDLTSQNFLLKLSSLSDVCFSLLSKRRLLYDSSGTTTSTDKQTNIYYEVGGANIGIKKTDLTASIKQLLIIEAIEAKYGFTFSRDFLGSYDFSNQYITLSGESKSTKLQLTLPTINDPTINNSLMLADGYGTESERETYSILFYTYIYPDFDDVEYSIYVKNGDDIIAKVSNLINSYEQGITILSSAVDGGLKDVSFWIESEENIEFVGNIVRTKAQGSSTEYETITNSDTNEANFIVSDRLPDIKIIDYFKGLFKVSKLVAIPQKDGTTYIDSLVNYYKSGKVINLDDYIDYDSHTVSAGTILNKINYNFAEPTTILNQKFKKENGVAYGDLELSIYNEDGVLIDGNKLEYKVPFENIIYEKIRDINDVSFISNMQYGLLQNETLDFSKIKPHIHYIENKSLSAPINLVKDDGTTTTITNVNIPLHVLSSSLKTHSITFGSEFNEYDGNIINNTIYSNYHQPYIESIFNILKREYVFKAINLPTHDILNIELNDVIEIKDNYYRIESFSTNTTTNDVEFKLINDINLDLTITESVTMDNAIVTMDNAIITMDNI